MRVGERLGFGMALALVIVAAQIVTFDLVPVSNRKLWINKLVAWSFYWVFAVLIQSVGVGFIYFLREDHKAKHRDRRLSRMTVQHRNGMAEAASFAMRQVAGDNDDDSMREKSISNFDLQPKQPWFFMYSLRKFDCKSSPRVCTRFGIPLTNAFLYIIYIYIYPKHRSLPSFGKKKRKLKASLLAAQSLLLPDRHLHGNFDRVLLWLHTLHV